MTSQPKNVSVEECKSASSFSHQLFAKLSRRPAYCPKPAFSQLFAATTLSPYCPTVPTVPLGSILNSKGRDMDVGQDSRTVRDKETSNIYKYISYIYLGKVHTVPGISGQYSDSMATSVGVAND